MNNQYALSNAELESRSFLSKVYGWMSLGLALTGWIAWTVAGSETLIRLLLGGKVIFYGLIIGELVLVVALAGWIDRMTAAAATLAFLVYAAFNGVTMAAIFLVYTASSIASTFLVAAGMFGAMSFYGLVTKKDLSGFGSILFMGLIGILLASLANMFIGSDRVALVTSYIGVVVFAGLAAYDTQKIKAMNILGNDGTDEDRKEAVRGALTLYLDFVNLFLSLLRIMGRRR